MKVYGGLDELLAQDKKAKKYFLSLPDYIQGSLTQRSHNINSFESMQTYANNLLQGDD